MPLALGPLLLAALSAQSAPSDPPRVALVLSSGGGRAVAHVGVLEVLEELRIPVELVVGSEAGAAVGGLYAAGRTPRELSQLFQSEAWAGALEGLEARRSLSWRRRVESRDFLFEIPLTLRGWRLSLPRGVLRTRRLNQLLEGQCIPVLGLDGFDALPTPFRAVATELATGQSVVLERSLASSLLASLATPVLLPPVELDGRWLVSGALSDSVPVGVALAAQPRVVIVVDCTVAQDGPRPPEDALDVAEELLFLEGARRRKEELARARAQDIVIVPRLDGHSPFDHRHPEPVLEAGRAAARALAERLAPLALPEVEWQAHLARRRERAGQLPVVRSVVFKDDTAIDTEVLEAHVETPAGERIAPRKLARDLERVYGLDLHERVELALSDAEPGEDGRDLLVSTTPAPWSPVQLRVGGLIEGDLRGDARFALGAALNWRPFNGYGAEWRNRVEFGNRFTVASEYYQPLDARQLWFASAYASWNERRINITLDGDNLAEYGISWFQTGADIGRILGDWGELRVGLQSVDGRANLKVGDPNAFSSAGVRQGVARSALTVDTLDSTAFPREGQLLRLEWLAPVDALGGNDAESLRAEWTGARTFGSTTISPGAVFGTALEDGTVVANLFQLGGFLRLSGFQRDELGGEHAALARVVVWQELGRRALERDLFSYYVGASLEAGNVFQDRDDIEASALLLSSSLFLGVSTSFGPMYLGVGSSEGGRVTAFLAVGGQF